MEVQEESSYSVKLAIRTNAWRNRAMISLVGAAKPSLRYVSKSIREVRWGPSDERACMLGGGY